VNTKFKIISVPKECNMINFAKKNFDNYDPDSRNGYYQFLKSTEEYIPRKTRVLLVSEVSMHAVLLILCKLNIYTYYYRIKGEYVLIVKHVKYLVSVTKERK
jgi:hypothetical protein